jgi:signal transduction histidine kinase
MKLSTYKNVHILIAIFVVGFLSLFTLHQIFTKLIDKLDVQTVNYESKIKIGEFISQDILELKSLYYQLSVVTTSSKSRRIITNKIHLVLNKIKRSIHILKYGGTLERDVSLNIVNHANITKKIKYINNTKQVSLELIAIKPEILKFKTILKRTNRLLSQRVIASKSKYTRTFLKFDKQLKKYYKTTPSFFNRMNENIKRLLFEGDIELNRIKKEVSENKYKYMIIKICLVISILIIIFRLGYIIASNIKKEEEELLTLNSNLKSKEKSLQAILNGQRSMVIVSNGINILHANNAIADFFIQFNTVEDFTNNHECICDMFENNVPNHYYITKKDYNGLNWLEYILKHSKKDFKVIMNNGIEDHHFVITANKKFIDDDNKNFIIIISFNDITSEINTQKQLIDLNDNLELIVKNKIHELQDLNDNLEQKVLIEASKVREKDKQMMQQARFAAMGEMIGNIAHQWRQPLSAINTTASGMQLQIQLDLATGDDIKDSYERIMKYVDFLTQTIEDFRNFFHEDKEKSKFDIIETIKKTISITSATYKDADITLLNTCDTKPMQSLGMPNELSQVFLNILTNAKDAIISNNIENKLVSIQCSQDDKNNIIMIQDNANGIPQNIIEKIFDPYFTTKHQTQGTGIGLYMSKDIVENHMLGQISVKNIVTTIDNHTFNGACFKISIPKV